jgi:transposase
MGDAENPPDAEKERLRRENERLREEVEKLRDENRKLKRRLASIAANERLGVQLPSAAKRPAFKAPRASKQDRPGAPKGHKGVTRRLPAHIDREEEATAHRCPNCDGALGAPTDFYERTIEDIVPARVEVVIHHVARYRCSTCRRKVSAQVAGALPRGRIGVNAAALVAFSREEGLSRGKIRVFLKQVCGLTVSRRTIQRLEREAARACAAEVARIREEVRRASVAQADETSWPVDGKNHWLWLFRSAQAALFVVDKSRGADVPARELGPRSPEQVLVRDGWGGYNKVGGAHQMCLVHVNREFQRAELVRGIELRGFLQDSEPRYTRAGRPPAELLHLVKLVRTVMREAVQLSRRARVSARARAKAELAFVRRVRRIARRPWKDDDAARIAKALRRWASSMFTFVKRPEVPWENNASERAIRGPVIVRKTTNGHRTDEGAAAFAALMSVRQTSELKGRNVLEVLRGLMGAPGPPWSGG